MALFIRRRSSCNGVLFRLKAEAEEARLAEERAAAILAAEQAEAEQLGLADDQVLGFPRRFLSLISSQPQPSIMLPLDP